MDSFVIVSALVSIFISFYILGSLMLKEPVIINNDLYYYKFVYNSGPPIYNICIYKNNILICNTLMGTSKIKQMILPEHDLYIKNKKIISMLKSGHYRTSRDIFNIVVEDDFKQLSLIK